MIANDLGPNVLLIREYSARNPLYIVLGLYNLVYGVYHPISRARKYHVRVYFSNSS
jgi:hypothetical protein